MGVVLAELLGFACATTLVGFELSGDVINAKRELVAELKSKLGTLASGELHAVPSGLPLKPQPAARRPANKAVFSLFRLTA